VEFLIILAVLALVVLVVAAPLHRRSEARHTGAETEVTPEPAAPAGGACAGELADMELAREAKYREIREAELDHAAGKLSDADFAQLDAQLRIEAVEILRAIDRLAPAEGLRPPRAEPGAESYHRAR